MSTRHGDRMTQAEVGTLLGFGRGKVSRLTRAEVIPHLIDPETGRPYYLRTSIEAWMRRAGELHAERGAA